MSVAFSFAGVFRRLLEGLSMQHPVSLACDKMTDRRARLQSPAGRAHQIASAADTAEFRAITEKQTEACQFSALDP